LYVLRDAFDDCSNKDSRYEADKHFEYEFIQAQIMLVIIHLCKSLELFEHAVFTRSKLRFHLFNK